MFACLHVYKASLVVVILSLPATSESDTVVLC